MDTPFPQETARSLQTDFRRLLRDEIHTDLTLVCVDGVELKAHTLVLYARSSVFATLLFGCFAEAGLSRINVDYTGNVVKAILQYCYTDDPEILRQEQDQQDETAHQDVEEDTIRTVVSLLQAADFYDLSRLVDHSRAWCLEILKADPRVAPVLVDAARAAGTPADQVARKAMQRIRMNPTMFLLNGMGLKSMHPSTLEVILKDGNIKANEFSLYGILKKWVDAGPTVDTCRDDMEASQNRHEIGQVLIKNLCLKQMRVSELVNTVAFSGLVSGEELRLAIKKASDRPVYAHYRIPRHTINFVPPIWSVSRSDVAEDDYEFTCQRLMCVSLGSGVHRWSIRLEELSYRARNVELGVASIKHLMQRAHVGSQTGGWGLELGGTTRHNGVFDNYYHWLKFEKGSVVTMTLDFSVGNGTLRASVNDGPEYDIFKNISLVCGPEGVLPAVSVQGGSQCQVRFLGFDSVI